MLEKERINKLCLLEKLQLSESTEEDNLKTSHNNHYL